MKRGFAIAAGDEATAEAGAEVLRDGGNAVDAAIAAALTAMVVEPVLASLLGGGFLMVAPPERPARLLDFFVQTPAVAIPEADQDFREIHADFGETSQAFHIGAATVAVPGVAVGLSEAHERLGRIPLGELAATAIRAAKEGVVVGDYQATLLNIVAPIVSATPEAAALFSGEDGLLKSGEIRRNEAFADVLETYALEGVRFVQEGEVAEALLSLTADGGSVRRRDLRRYRPIWRDPLLVDRAGVQVALNPPPALGGALIGFGLDIAPRDPDTAALAEVFAATSRARVEADLSDDAEAGAGKLRDPDLLKRYRDMIAGRIASTRGTTQISVIDGDGFAASLTLSNGEGCGMIAPGTGIMPNNMLGEEDLNPHGPGGWARDQRLSSMMCPTVADWPDGTRGALGSGGSNRIRTALVSVLLRLIDGGERLEDAVAAPRLHVEGAVDPVVDFEDRMAVRDRALLLRAFPEARAWARDSMFFGGVHGVRMGSDGGVEAAGDPRRAGAVRTG